jgi:hypothetical protein
VISITPPAHPVIRLGPVRARAFDTILLGGLTAGVLDITDAALVTVWRGGRPARMLQGIASGLLGPCSFEGGGATAALGLGIHFFIALSAASVFWAATRIFPALLRRPLVSGIVFGLGVWAFMRFVVIPLSLVHMGHPPPVLVLNQLLIHAFGVGLPIAWLAARSAREPAAR